MSIYTRVFNIMMSFLFIAALASCGGDKTKSAKVELSILPSKPIVITANTVDPNNKAVTAPWFSFRGSLKNSSSETVTLIAIEIEVTGLSESGTPTTSKVAFTPSDFNGSIEIGNGTNVVTVECKFWYFAQLAPDTSGDIQLLGADPRCGNKIPMFYIGSNPKGPPGTTNFRYTLRIKPLGWFGTFDAPTDRFENKQTFYTQ